MSELRSYFYPLFDRLANSLNGDEWLLCNFLGERSDFVRLNLSKIRQSGEVRQFELALNLISGNRSVRAITNVSGTVETDTNHCLAILASLREQVASTPEDPYLLISRETRNTESVGKDTPPIATETIEEILSKCRQPDLVGFFASGRIYRGFANSFGQRNWYERSSFNFEWSCFGLNNRAVKSHYAGFVWKPAEFERRIEKAGEALETLGRSETSISPGRYRVFLAPAAVQELLSILSWQGFGAKARQTHQSSLSKLAQGIVRLNPMLSLNENNAEGLAPDFTRSGFIKPAHVRLIEHGKPADMLVNSRSAKEYDLKVNADSEYPSSLEMARGSLQEKDILSSLDHGLYISNLWYTNYSDLNECRLTGMTRYACFRVENGEITAPISPMRFDESIYRMLGDKLLAIGAESEWILSSDTYMRRSLSSMCVPGLLIDDFSFTL